MCSLLSIFLIGHQRKQNNFIQALHFHPLKQNAQHLLCNDHSSKCKGVNLSLTLNGLHFIMAREYSLDAETCNNDFFPLKYPPFIIFFKHNLWCKKMQKCKT